MRRLVWDQQKTTREISMKNVLQINTSILGEHSVSKSLSDYAADQLTRKYDTKVTVRDTVNLPHLTGEALGAFSNTSSAPSPAEKSLVKTSDALIEEVVAADVIILGVPMYNFHIPSQLKSYFDFVARAGITFRYTENGPVGLLKDKKVYVVNASGGVYQATGDDLISPYIRKIWGFIGITDIEFVHAEGLAMDQGANKDKIVAQAKESLDEMLATENAMA
ncbi:FMN-dependent NADH-azoreductase [Sedimenticola sp.]|uniref:FMN-dependent NADH-azoreductase n=1 Tax=Sedimenticola sp. TaxID=1940285 RepID=UPI003D139C8D